MTVTLRTVTVTCDGVAGPPQSEQGASKEQQPTEEDKACRGEDLGLKQADTNTALNQQPAGPEQAAQPTLKAGFEVAGSSRVRFFIVKL